MRGHRGHRARRRLAAPALLIALALPLTGCLSETFQRGYVVPEGALEQIRMGAAQEQGRIGRGTPATGATVSGEAFYYISQTATRAASFMPTTIVDQRVVAIYFDKNRRVQRVADYGMKDGVVFDFVSRTTPTAGSDMSIIKQLFSTIQNSKFTLPF